LTVPDGTFFANATLYVNDDNGGNNATPSVSRLCELVRRPRKLERAIAIEQLQKNPRRSAADDAAVGRAERSE